MALDFCSHSNHAADMPATTPTAQLASALLGVDVVDWIAKRRDEGRSWRWVARDLADATDGRIDVTLQTLYSWTRESRRSA